MVSTCSTVGRGSVTKTGPGRYTIYNKFKLGLLMVVVYIQIRTQAMLMSQRFDGTALFIQVCLFSSPMLIMIYMIYTYMMSFPIKIVIGALMQKTDIAVFKCAAIRCRWNC
jgi:hypothetical protein